MRFRAGVFTTRGEELDLVVSSGGSRADSEILKNPETEWVRAQSVKAVAGRGFLRIFSEHNFILANGR